MSRGSGALLPAPVLYKPSHRSCRAARLALLLLLCAATAATIYSWSASWQGAVAAVSGGRVTSAAAGGKDVPAICRGTAGTWCRRWHQQRVPPAPLVPFQTPSKPCPQNCSGVGNCAADTGVCYCPAAWGGPACAEPRQLPCTNRLGGLRETGKTYSHIGPDKLDLNLSNPRFEYGRCAGVCDDGYGRCYCRGPGKYGRIPAPEGSPPGTPPIQMGRPTGYPCSHPRTGPDGAKLEWGHGPTWEELYGGQGWCVLDEPDTPVCGCPYDGWDGPGCNTPTEQTCFNQCSGKGICTDMGFCKCHPGWFGLDCGTPSAAAGVGGAAIAAAVEAAWEGVPAWVRQTAVDAWGCYVTRKGCLEDRVAAAWPEEQPPAPASPATAAALLTSAATNGGPGNHTLPSSSSSSSGSQIQADQHSGAGSAGGTQQVAIQRRLHAAGAVGVEAAAAATQAATTGAAAALVAAAQGAGATSDTAAAAAAVAATSGRVRPLIYVYNIPDEVVSHILQYRTIKVQCGWRLHNTDNTSTLLFETYGMEVLLPDLILGSAHRTLDPSEADFFYVPVLASCWMTYLQGVQDGPWFNVDSWNRVKEAMVMYQRALNYIKTAHPWWNASRGADHVWMFAHDEGACWAPAEVYRRSIIITHWARTTPDNLPPHSNYGQDNYSVDITNDPGLPQGSLALMGRHRCYTPGKDIAVPSWKHPAMYASSPYLGAAPVERDILGFHRGRVLMDQPQFSLGVRQAIAKAAAAGNWSSQYRVQVEENQLGDYSQLLARSVFCFVLQGDGWTARFQDAISHGCIPVIVMDTADPPWGAELDLGAISIRIPVKDIPRIPQLLQAVPAERIADMQAAIERVWHRLLWLSHPLLVTQLHEQVTRHSQVRRLPRSSLWAPGVRPLGLEQIQNDAFQTLIQVLHGRLPKRPRRRGQAGGSGVGVVTVVTVG